MGYLSQLFQLANNPFGIALVLAAGYFVLTTNASQRRWHWLGLGLCGYAASLYEFRDEFVEKSPPLAFPLEQLRLMGRPLTMLVLVLLLIIALRTRRGWRLQYLPAPLYPLLAIQGILLFKVFAEGDVLFGLLSSMTYGAVIVMVVQGPGRWLQDERNFYWGMGAIALVGMIFMVASLYQASINLYPITFVHGKFMGTTGNPQHAGTLLVATLPCQLFFLFKPQQRSWQKGVWIVVLTATLYALVLTGSRTGLLSAFIGMSVFFAQHLGNFRRLALVGLAVIALIFATTDVTILTSALGGGLPSELTSLENTRIHVWQAQWYSFLAYPIFGAPLEGGRLGFGENSWLAIAASTGIIGLIPAALFAYQCCQFILKLVRLGSRNRRYAIHCGAVTAGLSSLLVGSIAEAYLLGLITFPLLAISTYLVLGQYLLDVERYDRYHRHHAVLLTPAEGAEGPASGAVSPVMPPPRSRPASPGYPSRPSPPIA